MNQHTPILERFMKNVLPEPNSGCWLWDGACVQVKANDQRPRMNVNKKPTYSYRVSYELFIGSIPEGLCVCHKCDVPICVNPNHLFLGTHKDNIHDAIKKGRHATQKYPELYKKLGGNLHKIRKPQKPYGRKIPVSDRDLICERIANGESCSNLAKEYGVSRQGIFVLAKRHKQSKALLKELK